MKILILLIFIIVCLYIDINAQSKWPNLSKDTPGISIDEYEPPLYNAVKKLWLPDSIDCSFNYHQDSVKFEKVYEKNRTKYFKITEKAFIQGINNPNVNNRRNFILKFKDANNLEIYRFLGQKLLIDSDLFVQQFALKKIRDSLINENKLNLEKNTSLIKNRKSLIEAGKTLIKFGNDSLGLKVLKSVFYRSSPQEQIEMLYFVRKINNLESKEFLYSISKSNNDYVSCSAALILAQLGDCKIGFDILSKQINNADKFIGLIAIIGLAYIHNEESLKLIHLKTFDNDKKVKNIATKIYSKLKRIEQ